MKIGHHSELKSWRFTAFHCAKLSAIGSAKKTTNLAFLFIPFLKVPTPQMWSWLMPDCYCLTRCVTLCTVQELTTGLPPSDINLKISQRLSKELCLSIVWQSWHQPGPLEKRNLRGSLRILWHCINSVKLFCTVWLPGSLGSSTSGRLRRPCTRNSVLICRERYMRLAVGLESWLTGIVIRVRYNRPYDSQG